MFNLSLCACLSVGSNCTFKSKTGKKKSRNSVWFCKKMICRRPRCFPRLYYSSSRVVWDAIKRLRGAIYWSLVWGTPLIALMGGGVTSSLGPWVQPKSQRRRSVTTYGNLVAKRNYCQTDMTNDDSAHLIGLRYDTIKKETYCLFNLKWVLGIVEWSYKRTDVFVWRVRVGWGFSFAPFIRLAFWTILPLFAMALFTQFRWMKEIMNGLWMNAVSDARWNLLGIYTTTQMKHDASLSNKVANGKRTNYSNNI